MHGTERHIGTQWFTSASATIHLGPELGHALLAVPVPKATANRGRKHNARADLRLAPHHKACMPPRSQWHVACFTCRSVCILEGGVKWKVDTVDQRGEEHFFVELLRELAKASASADEGGDPQKSGRQM